MDNKPTPPPFVAPPTKKRTISFNYVVEALLNSVQRFPITLIYLAAFITWGIVDIWLPYDFFSNTTHLVQNLQPALWFLTANGILLTLAVYLWCEQSSNKSLCFKCQIAANILLVLDFVNILFNYNSFSNSVWVARVAIETALVVSILFVPVFRKGSSRHNLMFSFSQFGNIIIVGFLILNILCLAIYIIFITVYQLFGDVNYKFLISSELMFAFGLSVMIFLGRIPTYEETERLAASYTPSKFISSIIRYILLPLAAIYTAILYMYGLDIIIAGTLPKGVICWMVTALTAGVYLLLFLLKAIQDDDKTTDKFSRVALRFFPAALLPLLVMMSVAIGVRINQYGMTVARLYVLTFNIWAYITAIYFFISRSKHTNLVAMSFAAIFLLTSIIPGLNYTSLVNNYMRNKVISNLDKVGYDRLHLPLSHKQFEEVKEKMDENSWSDVKSKLRYLDMNDNHSLTEDIADFDIMTGYYRYDPLFDDDNDIVIEEVNQTELRFGKAPDAVEIPEGYSNVEYISRYQYNQTADSQHVLKYQLSDELKISLNIDSIRVLNPYSTHTPIKYIINQKTDSLYIVSSIDYSIDDDEFNKNRTINNITVRGYLFTR